MASRDSLRALGRRLRQIREDDLDITQEKLSELTGVSVNTIGNIETGSSLPRRQIFLKILARIPEYRVLELDTLYAHARGDSEVESDRPMPDDAVRDHSPVAEGTLPAGSYSLDLYDWTITFVDGGALAEVIRVIRVEQGSVSEIDLYTTLGEAPTGQAEVVDVSAAWGAVVVRRPHPSQGVDQAVAQLPHAITSTHTPHRFKVVDRVVGPVKPRAMYHPRVATATFRLRLQFRDSDHSPSEVEIVRGEKAPLAERPSELRQRVYVDSNGFVELPPFTDLNPDLVYGALWEWNL